MIIGAHVENRDPLGAAAARGAAAVQVFLSPPQSYTSPPQREDAAELRASEVDIYVHAPYLVNVATTNNRVRHPSRQLLQKTLDRAAEIGAKGVIVHGGHLPVDADIDAGFANWRTTFERLETDIPVLIENTAGGDNAVARHFDRIARLWDTLAATTTPFGFCLDTCHAHASGEQMVDAADRILAIVGRIDLVHLNDSKDEAGSGRDRHQNLGAGVIDPEVLVRIVRAANAPVIVETPDGDATDAGEDDDGSGGAIIGGQAADIAWIRERL